MGKGFWEKGARGREQGAMGRGREPGAMGGSREQGGGEKNPRVDLKKNC